MHKIVALYKFCKIEDPIYFQKFIKSELSSLNILGTIIIGEEGINGTISGNESSLNEAITSLKSINLFQDLDLKESYSSKKPFLRLKIKIKEEIVSMGLRDIDPTTQAGQYIVPEAWNNLINDKDTVLIDTRNNYEYSIGSFENSLNPETNNFKEFPEWVEKQGFNESDKKSKNFAMFCTGGIRCEKASSYMKNHGFKNVFHLKGGILKYLEKIDVEDSKWKGECFVFDDRVSVKHDLSEGEYDLCHGCRTPITEQDKLSSNYVKGVSCEHCINEKTTEQVKRYKSRQKQINLAKTKNENHLGPKSN
tara:strand:+ start:66 stop:986 length:921 start_codon:yes stop_codon:yes gene_type:complete